MKMTKAQILETAKATAIGMFTDILAQADAIQIGNYDYAIPVNVDGQDRWVTVSLKAKDTITNDAGDKVAYDPFIEVDRWEFDKADKAARKAERDRKHAETVAKAQARKAEMKAKAEARKAKAEAAKAED